MKWNGVNRIYFFLNFSRIYWINSLGIRIFKAQFPTEWGKNMAFNSKRRGGMNMILVYTSPWVNKQILPILLSHKYIIALLTKISTVLRGKWKRFISIMDHYAWLAGYSFISIKYVQISNLMWIRKQD